MALVGDGVLAVTEGVPELDGPVTGTGNNLSVVGGEGNGKNVVGVADETAGGDTGGELPQAEGLVPGGGKSVGTVRGDHLNIPSEPHSTYLALAQLYIHSRRRCARGRGGCALGNRKRSHRGSGSR